MASTSGSHRPRVIVADDDPLVRGQLQALLESEFDVLAAVADGRSLIQAAGNLLPDIVVVDITMPGMTGFEATRELLRSRSSLLVVIVSVHDEAAYVEAARDAGALGYVVKRHASSNLVPAIRRVLLGERYTSPALAEGE